MADQFDKMMNKVCTIQKKDDTQPKDGYNEPSFTFVSAEDNVPCRVSILSGGREYRNAENFAIGHALVFMRPRAFEVTEHNYLLIEGVQYNIVEVNNPSGMNHHLEIRVERVKP